MGPGRPALGVCALLLLAGCSGSGNICRQACQRMKTCGEALLAKLDCTDPQIEAACEMARKALQTDCSVATGENCTGKFKSEMEWVVRCQFDPNTCYCTPNVCKDACDKQKDCAETSSLDCTDASNKATCDALQAMKDKDCYTITAQSCTGAAKTAAEEIDGCFLDHSTCTCPTQ